MKVKVLKQRDSIACGPTCIRMISKYFGLTFGVKKIASVSKYKKRGGLSNIQFVDAIKTLGLKVVIKAGAAWNDLKKYNNKDSVIVLSWMLKGYIGHFSILDKVTKTHIFLADPEAGRIIKLPKLVFLRLWFDYDELWYPLKNIDIQLRWMAVISKTINHFKE